MQIESLKMFCDVATVHSFSEAAHRNGVTQSTVSQIVQNLEKHLGAILIDRSQRPWKLTPEGKVYYEGCREILESYGELETQVKSHHNQIGAMVRVACIYSVGLSHMSYYAELFARRYPNARIRLEYFHPDRIVEGVRKEELDIGIISFPQPDRRIAVIPWQSEPMVIACAPGHAMAQMKAAPLRRLQTETFIGFDKGLAIRREVDRFLKRKGIRVRVTMEFDNIESIKRAVEIGSGISILPRPTMDREIATGSLVAVPFTPAGLVRPLGIIHARAKTFGPNAERFVALLKSNVRATDSASALLDNGVQAQARREAA